MGGRIVHRYRMNPCDCLFYAYDHLLRQHQYPGGWSALMLELSGLLPPATVQLALERALHTHPVTMSVPTLSRWRAWPYWVFDGAPVPPHFAFDDLSNEVNWIAAVDERCQAHFATWWDWTQPPAVHLEHYRGPNDRHRICLRWPHALMDADGGYQFLAEMNRLAGGPPGEPPADVLPDESPADPLAGIGFLRRLRLTIGGLREHLRRLPPRGQTLCELPPEHPADAHRLRYLIRAWSPETSAQVRAEAKRVAPAGPALYARHLAGCTLRAVHRLHDELGLRLAFRGLMFPMRVPGLAGRPVWGNYLTAATLIIPAGHIEDRHALAADVARQLGDFARGPSALASWAFQRLAARLRVSQYRRLVRSRTQRQPFATGFAYVGEPVPPLRSFLGLRIENLYGGAVISIPPGVNVVFCRYAERLNLVICWPEPAFSERLAGRYAELIEQEALGL